MPEGISKSEFARRENCSRTLVRQKIASGHLRANEDGTLDPALVGTAWKKSNRDEAMETLVRGIVAAAEQDKSIPSKAASEELKEYYISLLRQLEYDRAVGDVVLIEDAATEVSAQFARIRTKLLGIGSRLAPRVAAIKSAVEIKALIDSEVAQTLQELSLDGYGRVTPEDLTGTLRARFSQTQK